MKTKLLVLVSAMVTACCSLALAGDGYEAPKIDAGVPWPAIGITAAALAGIAVIAFKKSNRTHLD